MKLRLPNPDILLIAACLCGLSAYLTHAVPDDQAQFILAVIACAGLVPVIFSAGSALFHGQITVDLLASVALIFSLLNHEWTSAVFINLMLASARFFSSYTENGIKQAIKYLLALRPQHARVKSGKQYRQIPITEIKVGDILFVELGERIPADGIVVNGEGAVNQSAFTGESLPINRSAGDEVLASTIVVSGSLELRADKVGADTAFERVIGLVNSARSHKSRITGIADRFAAAYIVVVLVISVLLYLSTHNLQLILSVLLVVCADDIAVAIPLAMTSALAFAARNGVIIKGGNYLEGLGHVRIMLMDKTGTITQGRLRVAGFQTLANGFAQTEILEIAAGLAAFSAHPVSLAVTDYVRALKLAPLELESIDEIGGQGLLANYKHKHVFLGRISYLAELGVEPTAHQQQEMTKFIDMGYNVTVVVYAKKLAGMFTIRDEIKPEATEAISAMKLLGVDDIVMVTGDNNLIAKQVSQRAQIPHFKGGLLPEDKLVYLQTKLHKHGKVAMVGDGVNDAPALVLADIGIAMGAIGSDVAIESADIVIMQDNLLKIPQTIALAQDVTKIAKQNFAYWGVTNVIGLILVFAGVFNPAAAAAYNFATDFIPILNSMRVLRSQAYSSSPKK